jgi:hypothetical protein
MAAAARRARERLDDDSPHGATNVDSVEDDHGRGHDGGPGLSGAHEPKLVFGDDASFDEQVGPRRLVARSSGVHDQSVRSGSLATRPQATPTARSVAAGVPSLGTAPPPGSVPFRHPRAPGTSTHPRTSRAGETPPDSSVGTRPRPWEDALATLAVWRRQLFSRLDRRAPRRRPHSDTPNSRTPREPVDWRKRRTILAGVAAVVAVLAVAGIAAALSVGTRPPASPVGTSRGPGSGTGTHHTSATTKPATTPSKTGSPASTASPSSPGTPGGPHISSISPSSGGDGQSVVVSGNGLFSADGAITAYLDGQAIPTACASQTSCTITVPDLGSGSSSVTLTIVTSGGTSNGVPFAYS